MGRDVQLDPIMNKFMYLESVAESFKVPIIDKPAMEVPIWLVWCKVVYIKAKEEVDSVRALEETELGMVKR